MLICAWQFLLQVSRCGDDRLTAPILNLVMDLSGKEARSSLNEGLCVALFHRYHTFSSHFALLPANRKRATSLELFRANINPLPG